MFDESRNITDFLMFAKIRRPSRTAATIVAKLSSASTISDASFATSVPFLPILQPMSAALSAGASFMPSPVIAAICPQRLYALIIRSFCSGAVRANTLTLSIILSSSVLPSSSSSLPESVLSPSL